MLHVFPKLAFFSQIQGGVQLKNVQEIHAAHSLFVASLTDGSVVTWDPLQDQLRNVKEITEAADLGMAALLAEASVVTWATWGDEAIFRGSEATRLRHVRRVRATDRAFAALAEGSVVTWGEADGGGSSHRVQEQLKDVQEIYSSRRAFAALLACGSVVTWGNPQYGGDSSGVQDQLKNVRQIVASDYAFAALLADGSVVTWGDPEEGGDSSSVQDQLRNVQQIYVSCHAHAALLADGSLVTWGDPNFGGDSSSLQAQLKKNVQQIYATDPPPPRGGPGPFLTRKGAKFRGSTLLGE